MFEDGFEIEKYLPSYFLDYSFFVSHDPLSRYEDRVYSSSGDWSGNLFDFLIKVINKIGFRLPSPFAWMADSEVRDHDTLLKRVIRETIVNALSNADFSYPEGLVIRHYSDEIIFENPGLLLMSQEKAQEGGHSDPRNKNILKMLSLLGMGERSDSGINLINKACLAYGLQQLKIVQTTEPDRTTISINLVAKDGNQAIPKPETINLSSKVSVLGFRPEEEKAIMRFAEEKGHAPFCYADLASFLSINGIVARRIISKLVKADLVTLAPFRERGSCVFK